MAQNGTKNGERETTTAAAQSAIEWLESLRIPEGKRAGENFRLADFQRRFIIGAYGPGITAGVLSVARGNGKSALTAALALGELMGRCGDDQPRREVLTAARTREQAKIIFDYVRGFAESLPDEERERLTFRRAPYVEVEYIDDQGGGHILRCMAADAKNALGTSPTVAIMDERGHWHDDKGDDLEAVLLSGLGKRGGRAFVISTSASSDSHSFSQWCDDPPANCYVQEHRPPPGHPADDPESIKLANPGAVAGVGADLDWLVSQAKRAIARGGSALTYFRLYNRNERVQDESRNVLLTVDQWLSVEVGRDDLPPRSGGAVLGVDLGGSVSMSAAALYWPASGRLEAFGAFPRVPSLADRGAADGVSGRYVEMADRGELKTMGGRVVDPVEFFRWLVDILDGDPLRCVVGDRYRQGEFMDALRAARVRVPVVYRGMGFRDGGEDCERFRSAVFDGRVAVAPSLLLRSAFADAVTLSDPSGNQKLAKARSLGRIDAAAATVLAVAEGRRQAAAQAGRKPAAAMWA